MFRIDGEAAIRDLRQLDGQAQAAIRQALGQSVALAQNMARRTSAFQDRTGKLRASITRGQRGPWSMFVKAGDSGAKYASYVEYGTKPHVIKPKRDGGVLAFTIAGNMVFARSVKHKGTVARHFMRDARDHAAVYTRGFMESGLNSVFR